MFLAGRSVTDGEVEEMLESGNPAVFTQGVNIDHCHSNSFHRRNSLLDYG